MDNITPSEALLFPADGRIPHLVQLTSSTMMSTNPTNGHTIVYRMPQPQVHMNYIATNTLDRVWDSRVITHIPYARIFQHPYVVFFPVLSQSGAPFPVNQNLCEIQGKNYKESDPWMGDIVVAKYWDHAYGTLMDCAMADYPLIKNWFLYHSPNNS